MYFFVIYNIKKTNRDQIYSIINQNLGAPFDKETIRTPFFISVPSQPNFDSLDLNTNCEKLTIFEGKLYCLYSLVIDVESEIINPEDNQNNQLVIYES